MPFILINLLRMVKSLRVRMSAAEVVSAVMATIINCPITELIGPITGTMLLGNETVCIFSAVSCLALYKSVLHSNSTNTSPKPGLATERTISTPGAPLRAVSTGKFTCASISSGAIPLASKKIVTLGRFKSGNTSTGKFTKVNTPYTKINAANATTNKRFCKENFMSLSSIKVYIKKVCMVVSS